MRVAAFRTGAMYIRFRDAAKPLLGNAKGMNMSCCMFYSDSSLSHLRLRSRATCHREAHKTTL